MAEARPVTHGRVLKIAVPIVLSNVTVPLLGAVDTGVVGQMGLAVPIGAVGLGAIILTSFYWIFSFLRMGTSGLAAQAHGAGDAAERTAVLLRAVLIGFLAGSLIALMQGPLFLLAFRLAPASPEVEALARSYLELRIWGAPATIALYAVTGWMIALERTKRVLVLNLWITGVNVLLDLWFVLSLGLGVPGVALATLIAEWSGLGLGLWLCRDAFGPALEAAKARLSDGAALRRMAAVNSDIMIRSVVLQGSFTTFMFLGASFGDVTLAANQVLLQFLQITAYALDGFAFAAEALVGQAVGARSRPVLRRAVRLTLQWGIAGSIGLSLAFGIYGPAIIDLMTTAPDVRAAARIYLWWLVAAPLLGVTGWMYDGVFIGATATREMRNAMLLCVANYAVALALLLPTLGNHGLWAALMLLNATRGMVLARIWARKEPTLTI